MAYALVCVLKIKHIKTEKRGKSTFTANIETEEVFMNDVMYTCLKPK